eukprot:3192384-Amphidinium_carterae.1
MLQALTVLVLAGWATAWKSGEHTSIPCGCSWSSRGGCGVSTPQFIHAFSDSKIDRLCESTDNKGNKSVSSPEVLQSETETKRAEIMAGYECQLRARMHALLPMMKECIGLSNHACWNATYCEWGAQQERQCGIDEE